MTNSSGAVDPVGDRLMRFIWRWRAPPADIGERMRRRITVHLLPFLFLLYVLAYLDRFNVSAAALGMKLTPEQSGLGFTDDIIGRGGGIFFLSYWILEIPSTLSVSRWGARWVFARVLVLWGICAALCGLIGLPLMHHLFAWAPAPNGTNEGLFANIANFATDLPNNPVNQFYFFRFLLGFFEGGFFPTVIVYLTYWFRPQDRARAIACFMVATPFSGAVGMPLSGLILKSNWFGLAGWRWVFILEGIMPVLAGIATLFLLPNRPQEVSWLPDDERQLLLNALDEEQRGKQGLGHWIWLRHLGMVALLTMVYFGLNVSSYGLSMFMPAIIKSRTGLTDMGATLLAGGYYTIAAAAMLLNSRHSDRTGERILHVCIPLALQAAGIFLAAMFYDVPAVAIAIVFLLLSTTHYSHLPAFWPIPSIFMGATVAASAIGCVNMLGCLGGFFGPTIMGTAKIGEATYAVGLLRIAPFPLMSAVVILLVAFFRRHKPMGAAETVPLEEPGA